MYEFKKKNAMQETTNNKTLLLPHTQIPLSENVRIQSSSHSPLQNTHSVIAVIQRKDWRSRSLQDESKNATMSSGINKKIHHTLPQAKLREFNALLGIREQIQLLRIFGRETDGILKEANTLLLSSRGKQVEFSEHITVLNDNAEKILNDKVLSTLLSLRSNLTLGPDKRTHDPGSQLDPNRDANGNMDAISQIYAEVFSLISTCTKLTEEQNAVLTKMDAEKKPYAEREEDTEFYQKRETLRKEYQQQIQSVINSIIDNLTKAEQELATSQHVTITETTLRPYDQNNWIADKTRNEKGNQTPFRKRGHTSDGKPLNGQL